MFSFVTAPEPPVAVRRTRRIARLLREQWILAALLGIVWGAETMVTLDRNLGGQVLVPGSVVMVLLALIGWRYPLVAGLAAGATVCASTLLITQFDAHPFSFGLSLIQPSENAAGVLLLLYVFWKRPLPVAIPTGVVLVASALFALYQRESAIELTGSEMQRSLGLGFLQVILTVGTGLYLRGRPKEYPDSPMRALLRRQWPTIAVLTIFLFGEGLAALSNLPGGLVALSGCIVLSGLAVLAPLRPVQTGMLGALTVALIATVMRLLGLAHYGIVGALSVTQVAAGMLLVAFITRHAPSRKALHTCAALVLSAVFALFLTPNFGPAGDLINPLVAGGVLLVAAVGTGLYFRARDEEREKTVHEAINNAQQNERLALARELHDVVAHHVTGIVVQAQAAQLVAKQNPHASAEALDRILISGTEALTAMRRLVGSMRGSDDTGSVETTEQATMDLESDLASIVQRSNRMLAEHAGPAVDLACDLGGKPVPPEVARSALRLVQEALTNSEKHALDATWIEVAVDGTGEQLHLRVTDNGSATRAQPLGGSGGYGLVGMRERVELLGGWFNAGQYDHAGWRVEAWLPLQDPEA